MRTERPLYHGFAWEYDLLFSEAIASRASFIKERLVAAGIEAGATILDAGCGTGRYAHELAKRGYHVIGVDRSEELLAQAAAAEGRVLLELIKAGRRGG